MNQSISSEFSNKNDYTMISLNVPNYLKTNFDNMVKFKRISRTSMLVRLMETFLRYELKQMKSDKENLQSLNIDPKPYIQSDSLDLPMPQSNNFEDEIMNERFWEERLK